MTPASRRAAIVLAVGLAAFAIAAAIWLGDSATSFNRELALADPPLSRVPPRVVDPGTPRLARRVVFVIVDGLRLDHASLPYLDELRRRGASTVATAPYPSWSRPSYVTILTGAPPAASGVRTNHVPWAVQLDTVMDRARAAGLRVAQASDIGMLPPLFLRGGPEPVPIRGRDYARTGDIVHVPPGHHWPFDDVRKVRGLDKLARSIEALVAGDAELVFVLAGDVDRAGHAHGGESAAYAEAAVRVDRALGHALAGVDLARDAIVVTSDHGHAPRGGHGGAEPEVVRVPVIAAGAGIAPGAPVTLARLVDLAPTIAALLGIPAPGHGIGRTLVELLALAPDAARRRIATDLARASAMTLPPPPGGPDPLRLALVAAGLAVAAACARLGTRAGALAVSRASLVGGLAFLLVVIALVAITRGELSPSSVPRLDRFQRLVAVAAGLAIGVQAALAWRVGRRGLARANGLALCGLVVALVPVGLVRAWFVPPHLDVPGPAWLVAIPGLELAAACGCVALALVLVIGLLRARRRPRAERSAS